MNKPNPVLFIDFVLLSGEIIHKTSNLDDTKRLYDTWTSVFIDNSSYIIHCRDFSDPENPDIYCSDTAFEFNDRCFNCFNELIYHILTTSTVGSKNIVTVIKSPEKIYEFKNLYEDDSLNFGVSSFLRRSQNL